MTLVLAIVFLFVLLLFTGIVFYGAPFVPTRREQIEAALDLLNLQEGQMLLELGAGDGRVAKAAAERGLVVVGYELNPILVLVAKLRTFTCRDRVTIKWRNYLHARWPKANGIFIFGGDMYMKSLRKKITQCAPDIRVASYAFQFAHETPVAQQKGVFLYEYSQK